MGCHTWFARPIKENEKKFFKDNAISNVEYLNGDNEMNRMLGLVNLDTVRFIIKSVLTDGDDDWLEYGYGTIVKSNCKNGLDHFETVFKMDDTFYLDLSGGNERIFKDLKRYHDIFRVSNYPNKTIHNRRELRKFMGKKYFSLSDDQLNKVSKFFRDNPGGIITFG